MNSDDSKKRKRSEFKSDLKEEGNKSQVLQKNDERVGKKISTTPSLPKQVIRTPTSTFNATIKNPLSFGHEAFEEKAIESGQGVKWHKFSNITFSGDEEKSETPREQLDSYIEKTGLKPIKTKQDWGLGSSVMYRSRRGSIGGFSDLDNGGIQGWRMHSLPTSEAFSSDPSSKSEFVDAFNSRAEVMTKPSVNTRDKPQTVNTILSDVGKVRFDEKSRNFQFTESTYAMGVSGKGLDNKKSDSPQRLYLPSIEVAKMDGKKGTPSQTYHSEPMSLTLHNQYRSVKMDRDSELVGMFASFPNQVCFQCGRVFEKKTGDRSVISGVPGVEFGGQKPGPVFNEKRKNTVIRAKPMESLIDSEKNVTELRSLYAYHKK
ncbi:hypothetical protein [Lysobacter brunescens]|uniref:Uncharacterized protein n=1 Tax=Lysobacter brunescens TaxID=262323 RepID=A0ABW2YDE6_9GAMM